MKELILAGEKMSSALELTRGIVGIRFLKTEDDYHDSTAPAPRGKIPYCVMIKDATLGRKRKSNLEKSGCWGGTRAIGLEHPSEEFKSGEEYYSFEMYENREVSKSFASKMAFAEEIVFGVEVMPLHEFLTPPDVVIIVTNPYNCMRIAQGYSYKFGHHDGYRISGNQAMCSECTAIPYVKDTMNFSMFCAGTRYLCGWKKDEMGIGFSASTFIDVSDGVYFSINGAETNLQKKDIVERIETKGLSSPRIKKDEAYFIRIRKNNKDEPAK